MENTNKESLETSTAKAVKEFKTMEIQTKPTIPTSFKPNFQQTQSYYNQIYGPVVMLIMSFMENESNKKFYKNEVLSIGMVHLPNYDEKNRIKSYFPSCSSFNNPNLNFSGLRKAEFFILRSTCEDDIHKAIKYGIWTSTNYTNHILNNRFKECSRLNVPLFLIFT